MSTCTGKCIEWIIKFYTVILKLIYDIGKNTESEENIFKVTKRGRQSSEIVAVGWQLLN